MVTQVNIGSTRQKESNIRFEFKCRPPNAQEFNLTWGDLRIIGQFATFQTYKEEAPDSDEGILWMSNIMDRLVVAMENLRRLEDGAEVVVEIGCCCGGTLRFSKNKVSKSFTEYAVYAESVLVSRCNKDMVEKRLAQAILQFYPAFTYAEKPIPDGGIMSLEEFDRIRSWLKVTETRFGHPTFSQKAQSLK